MYKIQIQNPTWVEEFFLNALLNYFSPIFYFYIRIRNWWGSKGGKLDNINQHVYKPPWDGMGWMGWLPNCRSYWNISKDFGWSSTISCTFF
jgi:hypothetical protein